MKKLLFLLMLLMVVPTYAAKITNGDELIAAMYKKYENKWYKTLTFVQKTTNYKPDGTTQVTTWYEALTAPGKLRIDIEPLEKNNGILFADGMLHRITDGKLVRSQAFVHPLLVMGFDVYRQPVETTLSQLKTLGVDLNTLHEDTWQGRDVYVVGAKQGDLRSPQFWIDKKNLYFVRMMEPVGKDKQQIQEIQFNKYQKIKSGGWVSPEVIIMVDGKTVTTEEYTDIQTNVNLDANLYDPQKWTTVDRGYYKKK